MMKLFSDENKENNIEKLISELRKLPSKIKEIKFYEVGKNVSKSPNAMDIVLVSEFTNLNDLEIYRKHPEHIKVLDLIRKVVEKSAVNDYEI